MVYTPVIFGGSEEINEIIQPHKYLSVAERRDFEDGKTKGVESRPEEENQNNDHLGGNQQVGKPAVIEDALFHPFGIQGPGRNENGASGGLRA